MKQLAIRLGWQKAPAKSLVMFERSEFRSRLTSRATQGTAQRRQTGVAFFLVTFSLAKQEKVTSCRATPGEVDFDVGLREKTANPTYELDSPPSRE